MATLLSRHRAELDDLTAISAAEVNGAVQLYKDLPINEFAGNMRQATDSIARTLTPVASTLAVLYYDATRAKAKAPETYAAARIDYDYATQLEKSAGYAIAQAVKGSPLEAVTGLFAGAVQLAINNMDRFTISENVTFDPGATRWVRVPTAGGCAFCVSMAAIPELSSSDEYATWHNNCRCVSQPLFGREKPPELAIYADIREAYSDAQSEIEVKRQLVGYNKMKRRDAARAYPDLTLTTPNILKIVRQTTGLK